MRDYRFWIAAAGFLIAGRLIYPVIAGERTFRVTEKDLQKFVFVCRESGETFVLPGGSTDPEKHPRTGPRTLMPGLYCEKCGQWRASPPLAVLQQTKAARLCPTHRTPMSTDGPVPSGQ